MSKNFHNFCKYAANVLVSNAYSRDDCSYGIFHYACISRSNDRMINMQFAGNDAAIGHRRLIQWNTMKYRFNSQEWLRKIVSTSSS
jgi:hypothetical protein